MSAQEREDPQMATVTKTKLQNFIDGEFVDSAEGATEEVTTPANGEVTHPAVAEGTGMEFTPVETVLTA